MKKIIQFHMTSEELLELVEKYAKDSKVNLFEFKKNPILSRKVDDGISSNAYSVALTVENIFDDFKTPHQLLEYSPGALTITVGDFSEKGLRQSTASFISDNEKEIVLWKKIINLIKKETVAGVVVENQKSKEKSVEKKFRYSKNALILYNSGVRLLQFAGDATIIHPMNNHAHSTC